MKQVTIENVKARISELEMIASHGELSLRGEFELASARLLVLLAGSRDNVGVDPHMSNAACLREINEALGMKDITMFSQVATGIHDMKDKMMQSAPVVHDAEPSLNAMMRALDAFYADDDVPERAMLAAFKILLADVRKQALPVETLANALENAPPAQHDNQGRKHPATDNTAQQFEALTTSKAEDDMICYGERCRVCDEMIIGRSTDGLCIPCRDDLKSDPETVRGRDI